MVQGKPTLMAALLPGSVSFEDGTAIAVIVGFGFLALFSLLFILLLMARRQQRREVREIVSVLEELRSGRMRRRVQVDPRSSLALLADSINRLGQDMVARGDRADDAAEGLKVLLEAARDYAIVSTDEDWDIRSFSVGASTLFGLEEDEVHQRSAAILFDEVSWKDLLPKLARRTFRERGVETRATLVRRDGSKFQARTIVRQVRGVRTEPSGFLLVVQDITAQARLEDDLRVSEARYQSLVDGLGVAVLILKGGRILYANAVAARLTGIEERELKGGFLRDRLATRDLLTVEERLATLERSPAGESEELRCTLLGARGEPAALVHMTFAAILHEGEPAVLASLLDETVERRVALDLRRNESRLDAVLEATSDGLLVLDNDPIGRRVRLTNQAFLELFSLRKESVLGVTERDLCRILRDRGEGAEAVAAFLSAAPPLPRREVLALERGVQRIVELNLSPLVDRARAVQGRVLACRDLTEQKVLEQRLAANADRLRRSKEELEEAYRQLQAVHEDLERRTEKLDALNRELRTFDEMKSDLLANVSHELQTPLVSIRGYTEMILKGRLGSITEEQRKGLTLSLKNIDRLISMIDNLLAFARTDPEASGLKLSTFGLRPLVDECTELLREKIQARRIGVKTNFEDGEVSVRADRDKIQQVLLNLLSNAAKFNQEGGRIDVSVRRWKPSSVLVQVRDTGIGIPEADIEGIFDRFYQVGSEESRAQEGTGIGLAIVRNILRQHGCVIQATSRMGQGTTFSFTLPSLEAQADEPVPGAAGRSGDHSSPPEGEPRPVLGPDSSTPARSRLKIIRPTDPR